MNRGTSSSISNTTINAVTEVAGAMATASDSPRLASGESNNPSRSILVLAGAR